MSNIKKDVEQPMVLQIIYSNGDSLDKADVAKKAEAAIGGCDLVHRGGGSNWFNSEVTLNFKKNDGSIFDLENELPKLENTFHGKARVQILFY